MTLSLKAASNLLFRRCDSFTRLGALLELEPQMRRRSWLRLLGEAWQSCDNIWEYQAALEELIPRRPTLSLMNRVEKRAFGLLPETLTLYRGADRGINEFGLSWSLRRAVARQFPFLNRYKAADPVLVVARVPKRRVAALKLERPEHEVIAVGVPPADVSIKSLKPETRAILKAIEDRNKAPLRRLHELRTSSRRAGDRG